MVGGIGVAGADAAVFGEISLVRRVNSILEPLFRRNPVARVRIDVTQINKDPEMAFVILG